MQRVSRVVVLGCLPGLWLLLASSPAPHVVQTASGTPLAMSRSQWTAVSQACLPRRSPYCDYIVQRVCMMVGWASAFQQTRANATAYCALSVTRAVGASERSATRST